MRFLRKNNSQKITLVISDLHLGAGTLFKGMRNPLEDFHFDEELVEFLEYYSSGDYSHKEVELIINGDFLDFLAVPYVPYFDDEFWSESAALDKCKIMLKAHREVIEGLRSFLKAKKHKITYLLGNHDAELLFPRVREYFLEQLGDEKQHFTFLIEESEYRPYPDIVIKHGHEYELAHDFDPHESLIESSEGEKYFIPPWGSYYVTRVVNKFKKERSYVNQVRPIRSFLINGLIYDTLFTLRFMIANAFYFIMVRFLDVFVYQRKHFSVLFRELLNELELFVDFEMLTREYFENNKEVNVLIVGHTHEPAVRLFAEDKTFINTGTWTKMYNMDFSKKQDGYRLTYAQIQEFGDGKNRREVDLSVWRGKQSLPYVDFI